MNGWAVALAAPAADPRRAARFLAGLPGGDAGRAAAFLKDNPGFLGRAVALAAALELGAAAGKAGLGTALFAEEDIPVPPKPLNVSSAQLLPDSLLVKGEGLELHAAYAGITAVAVSAWDAPVPPPDIRLLKAQAVGRITELAGGPKAGDIPVPRETFFAADILAGGALRLRLVPEELDFSPLGQEKTPSALQNMAIFLRRLLAAAPGAAPNACLAAMLEGAPLAPLKISGPEAAETEVARLLLVTARRP